MLEALVLLGWSAFVVGGSWLVWRLAYDQGRDDARTESCCMGHDEPPAPMPTPDQWDDVIARILAGTPPAPGEGRRPGGGS